MIMSWGDLRPPTHSGKSIWGGNPERLGYIEKELDVESGLDDHGIRKYDYELGRFMSTDPLWEKYLGWNAYQYSGNNPVSFYDSDGEKVRAMCENSKQNIINSVESQYRQNISFDDNGYVVLNNRMEFTDNDLTGKSLINYAGLQYLVDHEDEIEVHESHSAEFYSNAKGLEGVHKINLDYYLGQQSNGIFLPRFHSGEVETARLNPKNEDVHIVVVSPNQHEALDKKKVTKGSTTAHELYGHALRFLRGLPYTGHKGKVREQIDQAENNSRK